MTQRLLDFDAGVQTPHPSRENPRRLSGQCEQILARLRRGAATNLELSEIAMRFSARIFDLRKQGYRIEITSRDTDTGAVIYELLGESAG